MPSTRPAFGSAADCSCEGPSQSAPASPGPFTALPDQLRTVEPWLWCLAALCMPLAEGLTTILAGLLLASILARWGLTGRLVGPRDWDGATQWVVLGLLGWLLVGIVGAWANSGAPRASQLNRALFGVAMVLGVSLVRDLTARERGRVLMFLLAGLALTSAAGVSQLLTGGFPGDTLLPDYRQSWRGQLYRPSSRIPVVAGVLLSRIKTAKILIFGMTGVVAALPGQILRRRLVASGICASLMVVLYLTYVRAAVVAAAVALFIIATLTLWRRSQRAVGWLFAIVLCATVVGVTLAGLTASDWQTLPGKGPWTVRRWIWQHGFAIFAHYPVVGAGMGAFGRVSPDFFPQGESFAHTLDAHCQHLTVLAEGGVFGFGFWVLLWSGLVWAVHQCWQLGERTPGEDGLRMGATGFLLAVCLMSSVHDFLFHPLASLSFWLVVGVILALAVPQPARGP